MLIGVSIYKLLERRVGKEWMMKNRVTIVTGIAIGMGICVSMSAFLGLLLKSLWVTPY